jgi:hypothetical protein
MRRSDGQTNGIPVLQFVFSSMAKAVESKNFGGNLCFQLLHYEQLLTFGHLLCCRPFTWEDSRLRIVHDYDDRCLPMSTTTLPDGERVTTEWYPMVIYVPGVLRVTSSGISSAADSSLEDSRLRIVYDYDD